MHIENLKQLRENKGVSQAQCAKETGIPLRTFQRYEKGKNIGDIDYLLRLLAYFDLNLKENLSEDKEKK